MAISGYKHKRAENKKQELGNRGRARWEEGPPPPCLILIEHRCPPAVAVAFLYPSVIVFTQSSCGPCGDVGWYPDGLQAGVLTPPPPLEAACPKPPRTGITSAALHDVPETSESTLDRPGDWPCSFDEHPELAQEWRTG